MDDSLQSGDILTFFTHIYCKCCGGQLVFYARKQLLSKIVGDAVVTQIIADRINDGEMEQVCAKCYLKSR